MVATTVVLALFGIGLLALGWWGSRSRGQLGGIPGFDDRPAGRRQGDARRGAVTCYVAGVIFLVLAVLTVLVK